MRSLKYVALPQTTYNLNLLNFRDKSIQRGISTMHLGLTTAHFYISSLLVNSLLQCVQRQVTIT